MRTHRLEGLSIKGSKSVLRELPNFDFYNLGHVRRLCLVADEKEEDQFHLELEASYDEDGKKYTVFICFFKVRMADVPKLAPSFYFGELEIEDVSHDQLEGIRYRAKDYLTTGFEVLCGEIEVAIRAADL